ncbi:MAG: SDR family NAD(P)-dependent oxidoreductase, partial [Planctomycetota bacterium]
MNSNGLPASIQPTQPPLAVVGLSALFPKAASAEEFWSNIRRGVDSITEIPDTHWNPDDYFDENQKSPDMTYARRGGFLSPLPFDPLEFGISPTNLEAIDTSQLLGLVGAKRALEHAGYGAKRQFDRSRVGCILGVTGTLEMVIPLGARLGHPKWRKALKDAGVADDVAEDVVNRISESYVPWQENSFPGLLGNVVAGRIANRLDLHGTNCVVDAACASSLSAIHLAALELWTGRSDMIVTGGIDTFNDIFMFMCFSKTPALSPTGDAKPFSEDANGTILGEGVGMLVLKRLADAERDGDRIYAVIKGIGTSSDGAGNAVYAPKADGQIRCLQDAYRVAGVSPDTIELVEAHGTGTKVGDATEVSGLMQVYKSTGRRGAWCAVGSVKSQIGHTKAAAGAAGVLKAILALQHRVLPPTIKVNQPPAAMLAEDSPFYVNTEARPWLKPHGHPRRAAVSAFGFGGSNFHCVLEESPQSFDEPDWDGDVQVVALSGDSTQHLASQLQAWAEPSEWPSVRSRAASSRASFRIEHLHRVLFVVERDKTDIARVVTGALTMLDKYADRVSWSTPDGAYYGRGARAGALGVLFPGQGSQYVGMLRELACRFPAMNDVLAEANEVFSSTLNHHPSTVNRLSDFIYPTPSWTDEVRARRDDELRATQIAQPAIGAVSLGALAVLDQFGVRAEAAAGHSYGELTALCASRRFQPAALYRLSMLRGRLMAEAQEVDGGMLAIGAPLNQVEAVIKELAVDLVVANYNSPNQVVLSGRLPEIDRATALFAGRNMRGKKLQVAAAFHSPLVATASRAFRPELDHVEFAPSEMPVYANTTATAYPSDPRAARDLLASQLAKPVNFVREVEQMYADGVRTFLEVGPGGVLTGLVNSILSGRDFRAVALDSSSGKRGGVFDLASTLAQLSASGHSIQWSQWDPLGSGPPENTGSPNRLRIPICGANYVKPRAPIPPRPQGPTSFETLSPSHVVPPKSRVLDVDPFQRSQPIWSEPSRQPSPVNEAPVVTEAPAAPSHVTAEPPRAASASGRDVSALATIQENLRVLQRMQEETARLHQRFLEGQEAALRTFESLAQRHLELTQGAGSSEVRSAERGVRSEEPVAPTAVAAPFNPQPSTFNLLPASPLPAPNSAFAVRSEEPVASAAFAAPFNPQPSTFNPPSSPPLRAPSSALTSTVLAVVSEKTGYPVEMLNLGMSLDHDLGIDSIKRVEILSALQERVPNLPAFQPEELGALHTLQDVVGLAEARSAECGVRSEENPLTLALSPQGRGEETRQLAPTAVSIPTLNPQPSTFNPTSSRSALRAPSSALTSTVLAVVSEKTGYPVEMLNLEMSLDHDLGIDSIKRVEILSALQERVPNLPAFQPEELGALHTLQDVVGLAEARSAERGARSEEPVVPVVVAVPPLNPQPSTLNSPPSSPLRAPSSALTATVLAVVSEKTGYPVEMLNLEMSLDHDLGIDSIKRVEILSALQERVPNLPAFQPEELGALHTLQDVVGLAEARSAERGVRSEEPVAPIADSVPTLNLPPSTFNPPSSSALDTLTRSIVRLVGLPPCDTRPSVPLARGAEVWITEDGLELSLRIAAELSERGFKPRVVNLDEPFLPAVPDRLDGLIVVAPAEGISNLQLWRAVEWLQKAGPGLRRTAATGVAVFATVSRLNGRFGFEPTRPLTDPLSGGLAGLTKSAAREWPELACKAFDLAEGWPAPGEAARAVVDELLRVGPIEIGLSAQGRCTPSVVDEGMASLGGGSAPVQPGDLVVVSGGARGVTAEAALAMAHAWRPRLAILGRSPEPTREPEWLSGLATEAQIKQALIARSPVGTVPRAIDAQCKQIVAQREVAAALSKLRATGVSLTYHAVDVRDLATVRPLISQLQREFGPVRGLIHGAGVLADGRIEDKTREQFERVFETKVSGLRNLLGAVLPDDLRVLGLFSSYTARYGRVGQCDYAIANEALNKLSRQFSIEHPQTRVVSFNWGPWDGGMVTGGLKQLFASEGVGLIPLAEGAELLVREFTQNVSRPVELLVIGETDAARAARRQQQAERDAESVSQQTIRDAAVSSEFSQPSINGSGSNIDLARVPTSGPAYQVGSSNVLLAGPSPARPYGKPPAPGTSSSWVFGEIGQATTPETSETKPSFERLLDVAQHPFLESHVIGGKAVLPVAMIVEWLAHGAIHRNPGLELHGFDDLRIFQGVRIDRQTSATLRVLAAKPTRTEGSFHAKVQLVGNCSPAAPSAGRPVGGATGLQVGATLGREVVHAGGCVILSPGYPPAPAATLRVTPRGYSLDVATAYATRLFHGPQLFGIAAVEACSADGIVVDART